MAGFYFDSASELTVSRLHARSHTYDHNVIPDTD
jgi:hypothetical protein